MMFIKPIFALLALIAGVSLATPVPESSTGVSYEAREILMNFDARHIIEARAIIEKRAVKIQVTFQNDLGAANPANAVEREKARTAAKASAQRLLNLAEKSLGLSGTLEVVFMNDFHGSRTEPGQHITFSFTAPKCGGTCVAHGFPGSAKKAGDIFAANHKVLFSK